MTAVFKYARSSSAYSRMSTSVGSKRHWNTSGHFTTFCIQSCTGALSPELRNSCSIYFPLRVEVTARLSVCCCDCRLCHMGKKNRATYYTCVTTKPNSLKYLNSPLFKEENPTKHISFLCFHVRTSVFSLPGSPKSCSFVKITFLLFVKSNSILIIRHEMTLMDFQCSCLRKN